jgi:HEAT repeat protein
VRAVDRFARCSLSRRRGVATLAVVAGALLGACGSSPRPVQPEFDLHSPSGARRLEAIGVTVRNRDMNEVPALFALLDDDDEAVRLAAAAALEQLVGSNPGYRAYAPREERLAMAQTWRARTTGGAGLRPTGPSSGGPGYTGEPIHVSPR